MRNLVAHPITREEIVSCLRRLEAESPHEGLTGDMTPLLLAAAAEIVERADERLIIRAAIFPLPVETGDK